MKIVLLNSVDNLGQAGDAVDVKRGYFRNFLGPRQMALVANPANLKLVESKKKKLQALVAVETADASALKAKLDGGKLKFELRAGERGQLFGSVTTRDIQESIQSTLGVEVDRRKIDAIGLKSIGDHVVKVRIYPGVIATLTATIERLVTPEEQAELDAQAQAQADRAASRAARKAADKAAEAEAAPAEAEATAE